MNAEETEIRRHANGSIDIEYYVNKCHRMRSQRAHSMIGRFAGLARALVRALLTRRRPAGDGQVASTPRRKTDTRTRRQMLRRAA
jgi:hypothetical protein